MTVVTLSALEERVLRAHAGCTIRELEAEARRCEALDGGGSQVEFFVHEIARILREEIRRHARRLEAVPA